MPTVVSTSIISPDADRVAILINPKAGPTDARPRADRLAMLLEKHGFHVERFTDLAAATGQANRWHAEGRLRALVGVGGDGTAAELVNRTDDGVPLALFPGGNSNLLACYYGLTKDPETMCRVIVEGTAARIDAGRANGRIFLLMVGCGFDAAVVNLVHKHRSGHINLTNYLGPLVNVVRNYDYPEMQVHWEDEGSPGTGPFLRQDEPQSARWLFAFNLPCYGGGFRIASHANGSDGLLDLCGFHQGRFWKCFFSVMFRQHRHSADWSTHRFSRARITSEAKVPYQLDGDPGGWLPLEVESLPGRLTLIVPHEVVETSAK